MNESESSDPSQEKDHPEYGERPDSPDEGHPARDTEPVGGIEGNVNEHPEDVAPPGGSERDDVPTTSPAPPPDPDN
jgi:hypothetical protein